jgi:hypothetical protein
MSYGLSSAGTLQARTGLLPTGRLFLQDILCTGYFWTDGSVSTDSLVAWHPPAQAVHNAQPNPYALRSPCASQGTCTDIIMVIFSSMATGR